MNFRRFLFCLLSAVALLAVPAALASSAPPKREEARVVVPNSTLNGQPFELLLDTGSDSSLFTDSALQRLGIPFARPPLSTPASPGSIPLGTSDAVDLAIGTQKFHLQLSVYSISFFDALLGWPEIKNNILVFDSEKRVVRNIPELPKETADWQKFKIGPDFALTFLVPLPDGTNGTIMVDTGASHGLSLSPARWQQWHAAHPQAPTISERFVGISVGSGTFVEALADEISLGPISLTDIMVGEATAFEYTEFDHYIGTFGLEALSRLNLIVDGKNGFVYLQPKPKPDAAHPTSRPAGLGDWTLDAAVPLNLDGLLLQPGWYYMLTGDFKSAAAAWAKAVEKFPTDPVAWACLGWARENSGDAAGAANAYQHARMNTPSVAAILRGNGTLLQSKGDNMRAIINYEVSLAVLQGKNTTAFESKTLDTPGHDDEAQLNDLGHDGWELIRWGLNPTSGQVHYVFQRPTPAPIKDTLKIISAEYGASNKMADVTAIVTQLIQSGQNDFFAAEKWLKAEPAKGVRKSLKINYEFNGQAKSLTTAENEAVSRNLLVENALGHALPGPPVTWEYAHSTQASDHANWTSLSATGRLSNGTNGQIYKQRSGGVSTREIKVISAYYGLGGKFADVTNLVANLMSDPTSTFVVSPDSLETDPYKGLIKFLLITYTLGGVQHHYTGSDGTRFGQEILLEDAALGEDTYTYLYRQALLMRLGKAPPDFILTVARWPDGWAKTIGQFLAGVIDEKTLFAAAQKRDLESVPGQQCEAYYFAGIMRLMNGDQGIAREYFQKSVATGIKDYNEYLFSAAELARLGGPFPAAK